jgi:hypothetical protein
VEDPRVFKKLNSTEQEKQTNQCDRTRNKGTFRDGKWMPARRLNGDEVHTSSFDGTGLKLYGPAIGIQHLKLYHYH